MITIHAGHNPAGMIASGAAGYLRESEENRKIVNAFMLRKGSLSCADCTVNDGTSQNDVLKKLCANLNAWDGDYNISVHLNAGGGNGVECWTYGADTGIERIAENICDNISALGFRNRGVKHSQSLYILKHTTKPTVIVEVCFVDSETDFMLYEKVGAEKIADAILHSIGTVPSDFTDDETDPANESNSTSGDGLEYVQVGAYSRHENAVAMKEKLIAAGFPAYIKK